VKRQGKSRLKLDPSSFNLELFFIRTQKYISFLTCVRVRIHAYQHASRRPSKYITPNSAELECLHPTNFRTQKNMCCGLYVDHAAGALITPPITVPPTQVFICSCYIHHLLTCPDLKQSGHLLVQSPVHMRPVDLVERVREHPACLMEDRAI
jgi:hypothetical protein